MEAERADSGQRGFTLVEVLTAFAIASVVMMATVALMHNLLASFDRGTNRVSGGERLVLAADRLAADIGSARFVLQAGSGGKGVAFLGEPTKITFIGPGLIDPARQSDQAMPPVPEVVSVVAQSVEDTTELVRRRAPWSDPRMRIENAVLRNEVVLLAGRFDAAFTFARMAADGTLSWSDRWSGEQSLPRLVKLTLRERSTGIDLLGGAEFVIHADAPPACAQAGAGPDCLTGAAGQPPPNGANANAPPGGRASQ
jgi:prepilin-type N-terminal cleavage/methylation domain-containing protein